MRTRLAHASLGFSAGLVLYAFALLSLVLAGVGRHQYFYWIIPLPSSGGHPSSYRLPPSEIMSLLWQSSRWELIVVGVGALSPLLGFGFGWWRGGRRPAARFRHGAIQGTLLILDALLLWRIVNLMFQVLPSLSNFF